MELSEIERRFTYHPPRNERDTHLHETARENVIWVANNLNAILPESREKSLALTALQEALMWANAALACNREAVDAEDAVEVKDE